MHHTADCEDLYWDCQADSSVSIRSNPQKIMKVFVQVYIYQLMIKKYAMHVILME